MKCFTRSILIVFVLFFFSFDIGSKDASFKTIFTIGGHEDSELVYFGSLTVSDRGRVFVTDLKRECVLAFSSKGDFLKTIALQGEGPGEINDIFSARLLCDDSGKLLVLDAMSGRCSSFTHDGEYIDMMRIPHESVSDIKEIHLWKEGYLVVAGSSPDAMFFLLDKKGNVLNRFAAYLPLSKSADRDYFVKQAGEKAQNRRIPKICVDRKTETIFALDPMEYRVLRYEAKSNLPHVFIVHKSDWYPFYHSTRLPNGRTVRVRRSGTIHVSTEFIFVSFIGWDSTEEMTRLDVFCNKTGKPVASLNVEGSLRFIDKEDRFYFATEEKIIVSELSQMN